jgi:hypothetical protein
MPRIYLSCRLQEMESFYDFSVELIEGISCSLNNFVLQCISYRAWAVSLELTTTPRMPAAIDETSSMGYISSIIPKYIEAVTLGHTGCGLIETSLYV